MNADKRYLTRADLASRYDRHLKTIDAWIADPALDFPKPMKIRGRHFFSPAEIDAWDAAQAELRPQSREAV